MKVRDLIKILVDVPLDAEIRTSMYYGPRTPMECKVGRVDYDGKENKLIFESE